MSPAMLAPSESIQRTYLLMARDAYVRGDLDLEHFESVVEDILADRPIAILQPGERVLCRSCESMRARAKRDVKPIPKKEKR